MPANPTANSITPEEKAWLWLCMAAWVLSFFLPAFQGFKSGLGFEAFVSSVIAFFVPIYGWVWPVNIFIVLAPLYARRIEQGKGGMYVFWLCAWSLFPLAMPFFQRFATTWNLPQLKAGYYLWQISLLGTATWFLWIVSRRRVILAGAGVIAASLLVGWLWAVPYYDARAQLRAAIQAVDLQIADFERTGKPAPRASPSAGPRGYVRYDQAGLRDLRLASAYMDDLVACWQRERISDFDLLERYPGVPAHPPDASHQPQAQGAGYGGILCTKDESDKQFWMYYRDVQPAALARAKLYARNANIEAGMIRGERQSPELISAFELGHHLSDTETPARVTNLAGIIQIQRGAAVIRMQPGSSADVEKDDFVGTWSNGTAAIAFAGGITCKLKSSSSVFVWANTINAAGRGKANIHLGQGAVAVDTTKETWGSDAQISLNSFRETVTIAPQSLAEVQIDFRTGTAEVLLESGSAEFRRYPEAPVKLSEHEKVTFTKIQ
jgi:hypothetical protein